MDPEPHNRESAIPKIKRPLQLARGKCLLVIKSSLFRHFPFFDRREKNIPARGIFVLVHTFRFNISPISFYCQPFKTADYFHLKRYTLAGIIYNIHTSRSRLYQICE